MANTGTLFPPEWYIQAPGEKTTAYLERLTIDLMNARNNRDYQHMSEAPYVHPNFQVQLDYNPGTPLKGLQEHVKDYQRMMEEWPEHHMEVLSAETTQSELHKQADVFLNLKLTGHPPGVEMVGIGMFQWRIDRGTWKLFKCIGFRGMGAASAGSSAS